MVNSLSAWLGAGTERVLMTVGGAVGAAFSFAFGDVAPLMLWLAIFVTADMVTGMQSMGRKSSILGCDS